MHILYLSIHIKNKFMSFSKLIIPHLIWNANKIIIIIIIIIITNQRLKKHGLTAHTQ